MSKKNKDNYIYLVGNEKGVRGYCCDKIDAKELISQRKGNYSYLKFDPNKKNIDMNSSNEALKIYGVFLFSDEEAYFLGSFEQYKIDLTRHFETGLKLLSYLKFDDDEKEILRPLLEEIAEYIHAMKHGTLYDEDTGTDMHYWSYANALQWFIENLLYNEIKKNVKVNKELGGGYY